VQAVRELAALPGVVSVEPHVAIPLTVDLRLERDGQELRVIPRTPGFGFGQFQPRVIAGRGPEGLERGIVLSRAALGRGVDNEQIAALIGQPITLIARAPRGEFAQFTVTVVGVDESVGPSEFARPEVAIGWRDAVDVLVWWFDTPDILNVQGYDSVTIRASSITVAPAISDAVRQRGFQATTIQAVLDAVNRVFAVLQALLAGVGGLAVFVASLGVVNTMLMAVYERTREIGILKATGASKRDILSLFLVEAGMMGLIAGVAGLVGGWLLSLLVDWLAQQYLRSQQLDFVGSLSYVPPWLAVGAVAFSILIGVLAGLYPAYRAASMDPVRALRHD
ncbi:MAG: ABC transporter permease, partial [Dehalococcoidia bacterium]|nr:ABC transporter permease [Dehalococcoidia bacterium]